MPIAFPLGSAHCLRPSPSWMGVCYENGRHRGEGGTGAAQIHILLAVHQALDCLVQSCFCDAPPPAQAFTKAFSERQKQGPYLQETLKGALQ